MTESAHNTCQYQVWKNSEEKATEYSSTLKIQYDPEAFILAMHTIIVI